MWAIASRRRIPPATSSCGYEDLLQDPVAALTPIYARMGLPTPADVLERYTEAGGTIDPGRSGGYREAMSATDIARFEALAGEVLERCGYLAQPTMA